MPIDLTGNRKKRPPRCVVTRAMADAGVAKLDALTQLDLEAGVTDQQMVIEVFEVMWKVFWDQMQTLAGKQQLEPARHSLVLPEGFTRQ